jgi:L-amino acid N-acyltransferase YncA
MVFEEIITDRYPKSLALREGGEIIVRPLIASDLPKLLEFFKQLSADDRRFLRDDVLNEAVVARWCQKLDYQSVLPLVAVLDDRIVGDVSLHRRRDGWKRHIGQVRVTVDPEFRRRGIASLLLQELKDIGLDIGLDKLSAEIIPEQTGAIETFEGMGFVEVATLPEYGLDLRGASHDLVMLVYELKDEEYYAGD